MKKAVVGGSLVLDVTLGPERENVRTLNDLFSEGKTTYLSGVEIYLGGCVGNTGIALNRLGVPVAISTRLGDDQVGKTAGSILAGYGIDGRILLLPGQATSCGIAITPPGMDRISFFRKGASQTFTPEDITEELLSNADLFHFGYPSSMQNMYGQQGEELLRMMKKAKAAGVTTSMDMSMPDLKSPAKQVDWLKILERVLPYVDIYVPSIEETLFMVDKDYYLALAEETGPRNVIDRLAPQKVTETADKLVRMGAKAVLLKAGSRGMYLKTADREAFAGFGRALPASPEDWTGLSLWKPARAVPRILSTTGAGDTAIAGFLAALLKDETPETALQMAALCASRCIAGLDTVGGLKPFEQMKEALADPHEWLPSGLSGRWQWNERGEYYQAV